MNPESIDSLIQRFLDGRTTPEEAAQLSQRIETEEFTRHRYLDLAELHAALSADETLRAPVAATTVAMPRTHDVPIAMEMSPERRRHTARFGFGGWPLAAGLLLGILSCAGAWAGVAWLKREPDPVVVELANADFDTFEEMKVGGFPKQGGYWKGDACAVVSEAGGIHPRSGAGMLQFLHSDGKTDGIGRKLYASDQWQLVDITKYRSSMAAREGVVAELEAWFNSSATNSEEREAFLIELFAIRAASVAELNAISSFWLQQSNVVVAAGTRRLVVDTDPATWERVSFDLPVPAEAKYLLIHLSAYARPGAAAGKFFPGEFADSVSLKLRPQVREAGPVAAR